MTRYDYNVVMEFDLSSRPDPQPTPDRAWHAGEMGCGELILKLNVQMNQLGTGQIFHLTALDRGAIEDIPAWCKMTGHHLILANHPDYWLQRKEK